MIAERLEAAVAGVALSPDGEAAGQACRCATRGADHGCGSRGSGTAGAEAPVLSGNNSFFAAVGPVTGVQKLADGGLLADVFAPKREWKTHPTFSAGTAPEWAFVPAWFDRRRETHLAVRRLRQDDGASGRGLRGLPS